MNLTPEQIRVARGLLHPFGADLGGDEITPDFRQAAHKARYRLGYPESECWAGWDWTLRDYLQGKKKLPASFRLRRIARGVIKPPKPVETWHDPTDGFGRIIGVPGVGTHHWGQNWQSSNAVDLKVPIGSPIYATHDGRIGARWGDFGGTGRFAGKRIYVVWAGNQTYSAHCSKLLKKPFTKVKAGDVIALSGEANGVAHLHHAIQHGDPRDHLTEPRREV